jgi:hypothetical protein
MNAIECFIYCIHTTGFLYPIIGLIILISLSLLIYYKKGIMNLY